MSSSGSWMSGELRHIYVCFRIYFCVCVFSFSSLTLANRAWLDCALGQKLSKQISTKFPLAMKRAYEERVICSKIHSLVKLFPNFHRGIFPTGSCSIFQMDGKVWTELDPCEKRRQTVELKGKSIFYLQRK